MKVLMFYEIPRIFINNNIISKTLNGKISKDEVYGILMNALGKRTDR